MHIKLRSGNCNGIQYDKPTWLAGELMADALGLGSLLPLPDEKYGCGFAGLSPRRNVLPGIALHVSVAISIMS
jgi:hypothetical protein